MDIKKLCMGCMKELEQPGVCPHCGYQNDDVNVEGHYLKPYTILNGKYLVGKVLGEGGFGITYIGYDLNLEMPVAIKEFYPNGFVTRESSVTSVISMYAGTSLEAVQKWKDNFINEARTLAKCSHLSGIVGVKDFFEENGTAYIAMEYLEGITLKQYIKSCGGKIEASQLLQLLEPVIRSLGKVHESGLIHRDISPDNIMLLSGGTMKLLDFGAARDYASEDERSLSVMLKPGYAPEEQYRTKGKQGPWSDIYAFAATIYKCVTGITPPESMERMRQDELQRPSDIGISMDPEMEAVILKGMEVYAENRYQSVPEFMDALYERQEAIPEPATDAGEDQPQPIAVKGKETWQKYRTPMLVAGGVIVFLATFVTGTFLKKNPAVETETPVFDGAEINTDENEREKMEDGLTEQDNAALENGRKKMEEGDYEAAYHFLEEAKEMEPSNEEIYFLLADACIQMEDPENAVSILKEGIVRTGGVELETRKNDLVRCTRLKRREKYQDGIRVQLQEYNQDGNIAAEYLYNESGEIIEWGEYTYTDGILMTQVQYYEDGMQKNGTSYNEDGSEAVYAAYERNGDMTEVYIPQYDLPGQVSSRIYYKTDGLTLWSDMESVIGNGVEKWVKYEYDMAGNQIKEITYDPDGSMPYRSEYYYDADGNMSGYMSEEFKNGNLTYSVYVEYTYDENGNRVMDEVSTFGAGAAIRSEYQYDALGNCVKELNYYKDRVSGETEYVNTYFVYEDLTDSTENSGYILPDSDSRLLSEKDLIGFTVEECRLARNEIYARYGVRFMDEELQAYFEGKDWYEERNIDTSDFDDNDLSEVERANRDLIVQYEAMLKDVPDDDYEN